MYILTVLSNIVSKEKSVGKSRGLVLRPESCYDKDGEKVIIGCIDQMPKLMAVKNVKCLIRDISDKYF